MVELWYWNEKHPKKIEKIHVEDLSLEEGNIHCLKEKILKIKKGNKTITLLDGVNLKIKDDRLFSTSEEGIKSLIRTRMLKRKKEAEALKSFACDVLGFWEHAKKEQTP